MIIWSYNITVFFSTRITFDAKEKKENSIEKTIEIGFDEN